MTNYLNEIAKISTQIPFEVLQDIDKRCTDWIASGGKESDPYIKQQLTYAKNVKERMINKWK